MKKKIILLIVAIVCSMSMPIYGSEIESIEQDLLQSAYESNETYLFSELEYANQVIQLEQTKNESEEMKWWIFNIKLMNASYERRAYMQGYYETILMSAQRNLLNYEYGKENTKEYLRLKIRDAIYKYYNLQNDIESNQAYVVKTKEELEEVQMQYDNGYISEINVLEKELEYKKAQYYLKKAQWGFELKKYEIENVLSPGYKMSNINSIKESLMTIASEEEYIEAALSDNIQIIIKEKEIEIIDVKIAAYSSQFVYRYFDIGEDEIDELESQKTILIMYIEDIKTNTVDQIRTKYKYIDDRIFNLEWMIQKIEWQEAVTDEAKLNYEKGYYTLDNLIQEQEELQQQKEQKDNEVYSINTLIIQLEQYANYKMED